MGQGLQRPQERPGLRLSQDVGVAVLDDAHWIGRDHRFGEVGVAREPRHGVREGSPGRARGHGRGAGDVCASPGCRPAWRATPPRGTPRCDGANSVKLSSPPAKSRCAQDLREAPTGQRVDLGDRELALPQVRLPPPTDRRTARKDEGSEGRACGIQRGIARNFLTIEPVSVLPAQLLDGQLEELAAARGQRLIVG